MNSDPVEIVHNPMSKFSTLPCEPLQIPTNTRMEVFPWTTAENESALMVFYVKLKYPKGLNNVAQGIAVKTKFNIIFLQI